jgi:hypothetical protein
MTIFGLGGLGGWGEGGEKGVEGYVFEEADFNAEGDDLAEVGGGVDVFAAVAEVGEREVGGAGEFDAGGEDGGVEIEDGAELDLDAELDGGGGEGFAVEDPAAAVGEGVGEEREDGGALFVAETLDVYGLHVDAPPELEFSCSGCSSEGLGGSVMGGENCGHVTPGKVEVTRCEVRGIRV